MFRLFRQYLKISPDRAFIVLLLKAGVSQIEAGILLNLAAFDFFKLIFCGLVFSRPVEGYTAAILVFECLRRLAEFAFFEQSFTSLFAVFEPARRDRLDRQAEQQNNASQPAHPCSPGTSVR